MTRQYTSLFALVVLGFTIGFASTEASAETADPVKVTLHPAAQPVALLKYRLLPGRLDQKRGNAAVHYGKVTAEKRPFFNNRELRDNISEWRKTPLEELRGGKVKLPSRAIEESLRRGALCMECDWQLPIGDVPYYTMGLSEVQQSREFGRILAARARIQIADAEFDDAVTTLQTGYALGRNVATGETLVNGLVGIVITESMSEQVTEFVQQPAAPNMYWALTTLPIPLIDMRSALDVERMGIELTFPELADARAAKRTPDEWRDLYLRVFSQEFGLLLGIDESPKWTTPEELDKRCEQLLPIAKQALISSGLSAEEVAAMPLYQIATIYTVAAYHELLDGAIRYFWLPYPQAAAGMDENIERAKREQQEIVPIGERFLPTIRTARSAIARADRGIAVLRVFEALRIYGASHEGKLPARLEDIVEVPIPDDPVTGEPFVYLRDGEKALLRGPTVRDVPLDYEITMVRAN